MPPIFRVCLLAGLFALATTAPAGAQSFLEKLFSFGSSSDDRRAPLQPSMPSYRAPIQLPASREVSRSDIETRSRNYGTVRTICVRMCDGFYFPISHASSARSLNSDNARCKAACGSDSRLFYSYDNSDPDVASMIDFSGRRYDALETAFAYRKALRPGCMCRPPPWSSAERVRHFTYALEDAQQEMTALAASDVKVGAGENVASSKPADTSTRELVASQGAAGTSVDVDGPARRQSAAVEAVETIAADESKSGTRIVTQVRHEVTAATPRQRPAASVRKHYSRAGSGNSSGIGGWFGLGQQQKYVWPGDAR